MKRATLRGKVVNVTQTDRYRTALDLHLRVSAQVQCRVQIFLAITRERNNAAVVVSRGRNIAEPLRQSFFGGLDVSVNLLLKGCDDVAGADNQADGETLKQRILALFPPGTEADEVAFYSADQFSSASLEDCLQGNAMIV